MLDHIRIYRTKDIPIIVLHQFPLLEMVTWIAMVPKKYYNFPMVKREFKGVLFVNAPGGRIYYE
jgi:hypothetical protein